MFIELPFCIIAIIMLCIETNNIYIFTSNCLQKFWVNNIHIDCISWQIAMWHLLTGSNSTWWSVLLFSIPILGCVRLTILHTYIYNNELQISIWFYRYATLLLTGRIIVLYNKYVIYACIICYHEEKMIFKIGF